MGALALLKDKLRHIKLSRVYLSKHGLNASAPNPRAVRSASFTNRSWEGFSRKDPEAKQGSDLIGCGLSSCSIGKPSWLL